MEGPPNKGETTMMSMSNPFLTFAVDQACNQARVSYLDTLARMQQGSAPAVEQLEAQQQQHMTTLDHSWDAARKLAFTGQTEEASRLLATLVMEWGVYRALLDVIEARQRRRYLDPADPDTYRDIQMALEHKVALLSAQLLSEQLAGEQQRAAEQAQQQVAFTQVQQTMQHQVDWHGVALGAFQEMRSSWQAAQASNQQYATTALDGVYQAQQSALHLNNNAAQLFSYATQTQQSAIGMQEAFQQQMEQQLPEYVEAAAHRAESKRRLTRSMVALVVILAIPVALVLAYVILLLSLH